MYDCKAPLSRFYYPDTRRIINAFIILFFILNLRKIRIKPKNRNLTPTAVLDRYVGSIFDQ